MKELSIEEKAKRYDEAISIAREINNEQRVQPYNIMTRVFPELIESEDEKIRKEITEFLKKASGGFLDTTTPCKIFGKWLAWLEKQGEQKSVDTVEPQFKVTYAGREYNVLEFREICGIIYYGIEDAPNHFKYVKADDCAIISGYDIKENGSPYPTKPAYKVEPKFKIGDFVVDTCGSVWKIEGITNQFYILGGIDGGESRPTIDWVDTTYHLWDSTKYAKDGYKVEPKFRKGDWVVIQESTYQITKVEGSNVTLSRNGRECLFDIDVLKNARLWTIDYAKDGDVLLTKECEEPKIVFILKGRVPKNCVCSYYCYYNIMYPHFATDDKKGCLAPESMDLIPATKEQRDLLFQKMREAGYEWDAKKKELNFLVMTDKVEPKFKVGDWITDGKALLHVTKFEVDYGYELKDIDEKVFHFVSSDLVEEYYHLWTIKDAKNNDILVSYNNLPFIFDGTFDEYGIGAHGGLNVAKYFKTCVLKGSWTNPKGVKPATKEQQDLLFSKMKEAGYKLDKDFNLIKI